MSTRLVSGPATGEVFTKPSIVDYMMQEALQAAGGGSWLHLRVLEPSCGTGAFVVPLVRQMAKEVTNWDDPRLEGSLTACDISAANVDIAKRQVEKVLHEAGCPAERVGRLVASWFVNGDFLLCDFGGRFDVVLGNPPYIRFDDLLESQQLQYRAKYRTFAERSDIYIPFFERSLSLLSDKGVLAFICSNRFVKSSYGRRLRRLLSDSYHVRLYLNMEHTQPFEEAVSAYPAIYVIDRQIGEPSYAATIFETSTGALEAMHTGASSTKLGTFARWYEGDEPWLTTDVAEFEEAEEVRRIFPTVEESGAGTEIGIGVASGADDVFVDAQQKARVEQQCLIPLVMPEDIRAGQIVWKGRYMLNPFDPVDDTKMLPLDMYPDAAAYLARCEVQLKRRYCAKAHPNSWYRTLDRIRYDVLRRAKILIPDIQTGGNVALDAAGRYYPHHNVYWISSKSWNLKALCVLLRSSFVTNQIKWLSVQMRGGSIRYQAQNLRSVRIPRWTSLSAADVKSLESLYDSSDGGKVDRAVGRIVRRVRKRQGPRCRQGHLF